MQKIIIILLSLYIIPNILYAQPSPVSRCQSTEAMNLHFKKHPELKQQFDAYQAAALNSSTKTKLNSTTNYTIPIVFHVLHVNGSENISDAQVIDAVNALNADFAKLNADTANTLNVFKTIASKTAIRFELAKRDPNGNCTNGIIRHFDTDANWDDQSFTLYSHTWDPSMYLNVYIVKSITMSSGFSAAGYTYLPGSWGYGAPEDAIVMLHTYTGTMGTSSPSHSHVLTHEVGHWLDLLHVFGWNSCAVDCNNDDYVNDTPNTPGYLSCPTIADNCTSGVIENYQNFMDYSYCCTMFTADQAARMEAAVQSNIVGRDNLGSPSNLIATGINPVPQCAPVALFKADKLIICAGQSISFTDQSNVGTPLTWNWIFDGATPNLSSVQNPTVTYNTPGTYSVQLIASNSVGSSAPEIKTGYITVLGTPINTNLNEGFETSSIPNTTWSVKNLSNSNTNWQQTSLAAASGNKSAFVSENVSPASTFDLLSPTYDLSAMPNVVFTFKWAAAERDETTSSCDILSLYVSTNCGISWAPRIIRTIRSTTAGVSGVVNGNFQPSSSQFNQEVVNISTISNANNVLFRFRFASENGLSNNIFIDDINISTATNIASNISSLSNLIVFPNPANDKVFMNFDLNENKTIELSLKDVLGKIVKTIIPKNYTQGNQQIEIPVKDVGPGIYFLSVSIDGTPINHKLIVE